MNFNLKELTVPDLPTENKAHPLAQRMIKLQPYFRENWQEELIKYALPMDSIQLTLKDVGALCVAMDGGYH